MASLHFVRLLSLTCLFLHRAKTEKKPGLFEGGTIYWNQDQRDPNTIHIQFRLHFKLNYQSEQHKQCSRDAIDNSTKLWTQGFFYINRGEPEQKRIPAYYVCDEMDEMNNWATGTYAIDYEMPADMTTAVINYEECCWLRDITNNGKKVRKGRGWNLVSEINIHHGDGLVNTPPCTLSFPMYRIQEGCSYSLSIPNSDVNKDIVKCRWTIKDQGECNEDNSDICGKIFYDRGKQNEVAFLNEEACTLRFASEVPAGIYAVPIMIEDFSSSDPETPLSKVPVQFLVDVFQHTGECRQPMLIVNNYLCLTIVVGQEFHMEINAIATASQYRITEIKVLACELEGPHLVPGSVNEYMSSATIRFTPTSQQAGKQTFCVVAVEEDKFWSEQSCFTLDVIGDENEREELTTLPELSTPEKDSTSWHNNYLPNWQIRFNRKIKKATSPAFFRVLALKGRVVYQVDTSGPDVAINGNSLSFPNSGLVYLDFGTEYTIHVDEGAVQSADNCNVLSTEAEWTFSTWKLTANETYRYTNIPVEPYCTASNMSIFLLRHNIGVIKPEIMHLDDPQCTGRDYNATHYVISTSYGACGTRFSRNGTDISFTNVIYIPDEPYEPGSEITRHRHREIVVICYMPSNFINTLPFDPDVRIYREIIKGDLMSNHPDPRETSLKMYWDEEYQQEISLTEFPVKVQFGKKLYFEAAAGACRGDYGCDVFLESCWATVSENPFDKPRHAFIERGCPVEDTVQIPSTGGQSWKRRFSVDSFAFLGRRILDRVSVHCNIAVCDAGDSQSVCSLGCSPSVTKRGVEYDDTYWSIKRDVIGAASAPGMIMLHRSDE